MKKFIVAAIACTGGLLAVVVALSQSPPPAPVVHPEPTGLIANADLEPDEDGKPPSGFTLTGDVVHGYLGDVRRDVTGHGVRLDSGRDLDSDKAHSGSVSYQVTGLKAADGRWFRFRIRGLAQDGFAVAREDLHLKAEFFADGGKNPLDSVVKRIYPLIEQARRDLTINGNHGRRGAETWRTYDLEFRLPFPEVDTVRLTVGFRDGKGSGRSEFWVDEFDLVRIADPAERTVAVAAKDEKLVAPATLVPLGGRWYYDPKGGDREPPKQFDRRNADQLLYLAARLENPFAENTTAWLRKGFRDLHNRTVEEDRFVPDNLVVSFTRTHVVIRAHNLPNHATGVFPDRTRAIDGNPSFIREKDATWYLPLEPTVDRNHFAMDAGNRNRALPMGPIGIATNGVVFFNPFDRGMTDATSIMDSCCGHPTPDGLYHYHKYPVCIKSPWSDDGTTHSPLLGWAFDGFPIYGPYEESGVLAKDSTKNPLNEFNLHHDEQRGWHYHVTPGKFPYILGGFWGEVERRNLQFAPPRRPRSE